MKPNHLKIEELSNLKVYPESVVEENGVIYFLGKTENRPAAKKVGVIWEEKASSPPLFQGEMWTVSVEGKRYTLLVGETSHVNAVALRKALPYTAPTVQGLQKGMGFGDRLGVSTAGHVRAARKGSMKPFFAQQSIREMERTRRSPQQVMDDATWGVFQAGYREGFGSDADHLKTPEDAVSCLVAGFTMFTVDPGEFVDNDAGSYNASTLRERLDAFPWESLETDYESLKRTYAGKRFPLSGGMHLDFSEHDLAVAVLKYGRAIAHVAEMSRQLEKHSCGRPFELEVSVDETDSPTTPQEHFFVASELKRLGIEIVSLAPRFVGRFEKGVDYIGDTEEFRKSFAMHTAIAETLGPYKISIHSGSDKFSIYPIMAELAGDLVHLKTAGTTYLEAVKTVAALDREFFGDILRLAMERYETDKASYHVSASVEKVDPSPTNPLDLFNSFDARQVLHVTYGSVLDEYGDRLIDFLKENEEKFYGFLEEHLGRHVIPFSNGGARR